MSSTRYRCTLCGNLTRFDVTETRRTRSFHHFTVGGELTVEDEVVLEHRIEEVSCRWCGHGRMVEPVEGAAAVLPAGDTVPAEAAAEVPSGSSS